MGRFIKNLAEDDGVTPSGKIWREVTVTGVFLKENQLANSFQV